MVGGSSTATLSALAIARPMPARGAGVAATTGARPSPVARGLRLTLAVLLALAGIALARAAWQHRAVPLERLGAALVVQDPVGRGADVAVVSMASPRGAALDAAKLYRRGLVRAVWIPRWRDEPVDRRVAALGVHPPRHHEIARAILRRAGVPEAAIVLLDEPVDGLEGEMAFVGAALRRRPTLRPIVLTARTHTARARVLLRDVYAPAARARVRAAHSDRFAPERWWRDRGALREVALEYAKWIALLTRGPSRAE